MSQSLVDQSAHSGSGESTQNKKGGRIKQQMQQTTSGPQQTKNISQDGETTQVGSSTQILSTSTTTTSTKPNCWENFPPNLFAQQLNSGATRGPKVQPDQPQTRGANATKSTIPAQSLNILQLSSQHNSNETDDSAALAQSQLPPRKGSMADCDMEDDSCEEVQNEEEKETRFQINQKLIKNKNQFKDYTAQQQMMSQGMSQRGQAQHEGYIGNHKQDQGTKKDQQYIMIMDKRSRSETPHKMTAADVLMKAHQKLQSRLRKSSPSKLLEKHRLRQQKAEEFRTQIEASKKKWYEKIRQRQLIAKQRWKELLAERKRALYDKLEQAEERRESEIEILRNKAKQELQKIDETNYIVKMTVNNMKLDITNKMTETQERRNQIMEENKRKHQDRHLKEEAAEKRRQDLLREQENKIFKQKQRREQAQIRRKQMLEQRKRASQEYQKRIKVLQRKNDLDKISDVMSFVNNSEFIWEFLGNEEELEEDDMILELIQKDQLEIQKYKLKRDAEFLNKMIVQDEEGNIYAQKQYLHYVQKNNKKRKRGQHHFAADSSSSESSDEEYIMAPVSHYDFDDQMQNEVHTPTNGSHNKQPLHHQSTPKRIKVDALNEERKSNDCFSDNDSIAEESALRDNSEEKLSYYNLHNRGNQSNDFSSTHNSNLAQILTDDAQNYMLYQIRMKMSMKRNILKKSLSEDLTWADFLKNDSQPPFNITNYQNQFIGQLHARSLYSTPERRVEISGEDEEDRSQNLMHEEPQKINTAQSVASGHSHGQASFKRKKGRSSNKNHHSSQNSFSGINVGGSVAGALQQQNTISSNTSDKQSRISSIVYPSTKKKNPLNEKFNMSSMNAQGHSSVEQPQLLTQSSLSGLAALKQRGGSNTSSTHSLMMIHTNAVVAGHVGATAETPREGVIINIGSMNLSHGRKSLVIETDSGRKKQCNTARINHQSAHSQDLSSLSGVIPQNIFNTQLGNPNITTMMTSLIDDNDKNFFDGGTAQNNQAAMHTGSQMNQLLTNSKPIPALKQIIPKKLTTNAIKLLFPLQPQKLLLKRPGKDGQFGKFKVSLQIQELLLQNKITDTTAISTNQSAPQKLLSSSGTSAQIVLLQNPSEILRISNDQGLKAEDGILQENEVKPTLLDQANNKSHSSTPVATTRKDSSEIREAPLSPPRQPDTNLQIQTQIDSGSNSSCQAQTPSNQPSKLLQIHEKFQEKLQQQQSNQQFMGAEQSSSNLMKKKNALIAQQIILPPDLTSSGTMIDTTPSPKKEISVFKGLKIEPESVPINSLAGGSSAVQTETQLSSSLNSNTAGQLLSQVSQLSDSTTYKDQLLKYLLIDNIQWLKIEDTQKTICLETEESNKLIDYLEGNELLIRYCRICEHIIPDAMTNEQHVMSKAHKKYRDELLIKDMEDLQLSIVVMHSVPGDIEKELTKEKEKALKRKVKRIKAQMISQAVSHETAASCPGKDFTSANKKRCQILCIELEKQVIPIIKDYDALEQTLKEIIKILDMRKQADLHLMRKLKFIPILIEICKRIQVCHKNEFKHLGKALEYVIKIINTLCGLRENRNYMLQTNRMSALIDLLNWCLNRPTQLFYGINFIPQLFHILTMHVKHRAPYECQQMKELFIEYLISSQITMKIKGKFQIINGPLDLSEMMGQVPLFLLKSANFLEALTSLISIDSVSRPVYEKSEKIAEHVFFVIQNTELFGIIQMIATILLTRNQPFKPSQSSHSTMQHKILPQTLLSLAITSIKIINNVYRMDYRFAQHIMSDYEMQEQLYHLFNYILFYTVEISSSQEDSKELLHETILLIGYFCLYNEKNQALLCRGENTIIQKLCALPIAYFHDKKLKEILFPTLIQASYKNDRILAIMDQEISIEMLVNFIQTNIKEELPKIIEEENDYQSMSSYSAALDRRSHRSPSISSAGSSQCSLQIDMVNGNSPWVPLIMRFPKKLWKDSIQFYNKVLY